MSAHETIKSVIDSNDVVLFMKGTPKFPQCGFSSQVAQILGYLDRINAEPPVHTWTHTIGAAARRNPPKKLRSQKYKTLMTRLFADYGS